MTVPIARSDIIQGANWPEPVEVALVEEIDGGAYVRIVGELRQSRGHVDRFLSREEAGRLTAQTKLTGL